VRSEGSASAFAGGVSISIRIIGALAGVSLGIGLGCGHRRSAEIAWQAQATAPVVIARGLTYRYFPEGDPLVVGSRSDALTLDVDLRAPGLHVGVAAESPIQGQTGKAFGNAYTVRDWCVRRNALAGINGGFFGQTSGQRKQIIGLLVTGSAVRSPGRKIRSPSHPDRRFVRCTLGFTREGLPRIGWVTSEGASVLRAHERPLNPIASQPWQVDSAVACGPRLIAGGQLAITDREERLGSPLALPRTFVAYDVEGIGAQARPRHLLLGIAMQMTFADVAAFVQRYFRQIHHTACAEAMCLDGGSSSQLVYRAPAGHLAATGAHAQDYVDTRPSFVTVPTAILVETTSGLAP